MIDSTRTFFAMKLTKLKCVLISLTVRWAVCSTGHYANSFSSRNINAELERQKDMPIIDIEFLPMMCKSDTEWPLRPVQDKIYTLKGGKWD